MNPVNGFLESIEPIRLQVEASVLSLQQSTELLTRYQDSFDAQRYLHAWPVVAAQAKIVASSPRSIAEFERLLYRGGAPLTVDEQAFRVVMQSLAVVRFYRWASQHSASLKFAQALAQIASLTYLPSDKIIVVDAILRAYAKAKRGGSQEWLALPMLFCEATTSISSTSRARQIVAFIDDYSAYIDEVAKLSWNNQICQRMPW